MADWQIARKAGACGACERSFEEDEPHLSLLYLSGEEPARSDVCQSCFAERSEAGADDGDLWWWRTRFRTAKKRGLALNLEAIEGLFMALEERARSAETSTLSELRYILCLILMRKRRLKIERIVRAKDGEAMLVRRPRRKESLRVAVHDFTPERTDQLRGKLVRLFDGDDADLAELEREPELDAPESEPGGGPEAPADAEASADPEAPSHGEAHGEADGEDDGAGEAQAPTPTADPAASEA